MEDISTALKSAMNDEKCNPLLALFLVIEEDRSHGVCILQSEPIKEIGRGLRDKGSIQSH